MRFVCVLILLFAISANADPMQGISNHGKTKTGGYITAGDRLYLIGTQDGLFPDMGRHVHGEMGGLWLHPIKLLDGFWAKLTDTSNSKSQWLLDAAEFVNYPYGNLFRYSPILDGIEIERFQFCPDGREGMLVEYTIKNTGSSKRNLQFTFSAKTDLQPVWLSDQLGITDGNDSVSWDAANHFYSAKDKSNSWYVVWGSADDGTVITISDLPQQTIGKGVSASANYDVSIAPNDSATLTFVISGSARDSSDAIATYNFLQKNSRQLLEQKKQHYAAILQRAKITIPDQA